MNRLIVISMLALALPAAAIAKGASEATIEGPGLASALVIRGDGHDFLALGRLSQLGGFFPAVFGQTPNPMLEAQPGIDLGPRYTVRYVLPGGTTQASIIRQDLYPYARPFPVTYTEPGQAYWDGQRTLGGWYQGTPELRQLLTEIGLPATRPSPDDGRFWLDAPSLIAVLGAAAVATLGALALIARRRRSITGREAATE